MNYDLDKQSRTGWTMRFLVSPWNWAFSRRKWSVVDNIKVLKVMSRMLSILIYPRYINHLFKTPSSLLSKFVYQKVSYHLDALPLETGVLDLDTVECCNRVIQHNMILHKVWQWLRQNMHLIHKNHHIFRPYRRGMACLLWEFEWKLTAL